MFFEINGSISNIRLCLKLNGLRQLLLYIIWIWESILFYCNYVAGLMQNTYCIFNILRLFYKSLRLTNMYTYYKMISISKKMFYIIPTFVNEKKNEWSENWSMNQLLKGVPSGSNYQGSNLRYILQTV